MHHRHKTKGKDMSETSIIDPTHIDRLAELAVKTGLALRPGQDLMITAPLEALPLVRKDN